MFPQLFWDPLYSIYVWLAEILNIDQDVIQIYYNKDIKLFNRDFINVVLKTIRCIGKIKEDYQVLKLAISDIKNCLLFITFSDFYPIIDTSKIQLDKLLSLT